VSAIGLTKVVIHFTLKNKIINTCVGAVEGGTYVYVGAAPRLATQNYLTHLITERLLGSHFLRCDQLYPGSRVVRALLEPRLMV